MPGGGAGVRRSNRRRDPSTPSGPSRSLRRPGAPFSDRPALRFLTGLHKKAKAALEALKRRRQPYLNWAGKAERTTFEVQTVSLHVHERIEPRTIIEAVRVKTPNAKERQ